ncbi:MAG: hypothetical protein E7289_00380 [Lachnospiraceae bacterium]|nr:hypothetical protein [Lachnospiraceae bacterium]
MKRNLKEMAVRVILLLIGLAIAHLGVTLFLLADLGADPFNVLVQGIFRTVSKLSVLSFLTHGYTHIAICFLIILVLLVVDKNYIKIGTILCMVCGGPIIDFFSLILAPMFEQMPFVLKVIMLGLGCVILACGMTIVIKSDAGTGPNDLVAVVISDKSKKKFGLIRIIVDVSFVAAGFIMGGVVGIGTIICAFLVGPVAGVFMPHSEKLVNKFLKVCGIYERKNG